MWPPQGCKPVIICPDPVDTVICNFGNEICIEVPVSGEDTVIVAGAEWHDDSLCFIPSSSGRYEFPILATNPEGQTSCEVIVDVSTDMSIELDTDNLVFIRPEGGPIGADSQMINVTSPCDTGSSQWMLTTIGGAEWLSVNKTSGTNPDSVVVYASDSNLVPGIYNALLVFTDDSPSGILGVVNVTLFSIPGVSVGYQRVSPGESVRFPINLFSDTLLAGFTVPLRFLTDHPEWITLDSVELDTAIPDMEVWTDLEEPSTFIVHTPIQDPPLPDSTKVTVYAHMSVASDAMSDSIVVDTETLTYSSGVYSYEFVDKDSIPYVPAFKAGAIVIVGDEPREDPYCYPNPFNPDQDVTNLCFGLTNSAEVTIKVYDAGGDLVRTVIDGKYFTAGDEECELWDGLNGDSEVVANGVYFFVVESSTGERLVGKIAVLR